MFTISKVQVQLELKICLIQCIFHLQKERDKVAFVGWHQQHRRQRWVGLSDKSKGKTTQQQQHDSTEAERSKCDSESRQLLRESEGTRAVRGVICPQVPWHVKKITQTRGTREHQALPLLDPCSCTPRARVAFLRLLSLWVSFSLGYLISWKKARTGFSWMRNSHKSVWLPTCN